MAGLAAAFGGFAKSILSHNLSIVLPRRENGYFALGTLGDIFFGGLVGLILSDSAVLVVVGGGQPSLVFYLMSGLGWNSVLEAIITRFGCSESSKKKESKPKNPGNPGTSLGNAGRTSIIGCYTPLLAVHTKLLQGERS